MAVIKLKVSTNFEEAQTKLETLGDVTDQEATRMKKAMAKLTGSQLDSFIDKNTRAAAAVTATDGKLAGLETQSKGLKTQIQKMIRAGYDPQSDALQELQKEYTETTDEIEKNTAASKLNSKAAEGVGTAAKVATVGLLAMTAAVVAASAAGSTMAMDYTKSLANVNTMIDITADEMETLDSRITDVSNELAIQKTEISSGVYQALSAGASDLGEAMDVVTESAKLGKAALIDNASSVDIITTAMNAYSAEALSASEVSDTYFQIIKQGKISGEELSSSIGKSISLFSSASISIDDLGAGLASLTKVGVNSAEATTQLNGIVNSFLKPSAAMTAAIKKTGYASGAALLEQEGLSGAIEFLSEATGGNIDQMAAMITQTSGMRGAVALAADDMSVFNEVSATFADKAGAADDALAVQTAGFAASAFSVDQAKVAVENLGIELGEALLPIIGQVAASFAAFITDEDKMTTASNILVPALAGLAVALGVFAIGTKVAEVGVAGLTKSFIALTAAMLANPLTWIALAIGVVVAGFVLMIKNWDKVVVVMSTTIAKLQARFIQFGSAIKTSWVKAFNNIKIAVLELAGMILEKALGAINKLLSLASKLPIVGDMFAGLQENVNGFAAEIESARQSAISGSEATIQAAKDEQTAAKAKAEATIASINEESDARMDALKEQEVANEETNKTIQAATTESEAAITTIQTDALTDRLAVLNNAEAQARIDNLSTFSDFLDARMEQENIAGEARIEFLETELSRIQDLETLSNEERVTAEQEVQDRLSAIREEAAETNTLLLDEQLSLYSDFFGSVSSFLDDYADDNAAAVAASKATASAQAAINSYLAYTEALASVPYPYNFVAAGTVLASGLSQQANIWSAETGGSFTVPDNSSSSSGDSQTIAVNPGEEVSVTPRGETSGGSSTFNIYVDSDMLWSTVQKGLDAGEITVNNYNVS